jgi:hypothetical protein
MKNRGVTDSAVIPNPALNKDDTSILLRYERLLKSLSGSISTGHPTGLPQGLHSLGDEHQLLIAAMIAVISPHSVCVEQFPELSPPSHFPSEGPHEGLELPHEGLELPHEGLVLRHDGSE